MSNMSDFEDWLATDALSVDKIFSDLEESREQISNGQGVETRSALYELGKKNWFIYDKE